MDQEPPQTPSPASQGPGSAEGLLPSVLELGHLEEEHQRVIEERVKDQVEKMQSLVRASGARIVVMGPAGVGKSSCVNAAFHRVLASTGAGVSVTQRVTHYPATDECPIHIYDTKGFEAVGDNQEEVRQIRQLLQERQEAAAQHGVDSPEYIKEKLHAVWWVIDVLGGGRFSPEVLATVKGLFAQEDIPVILVLSKCDTARDYVEEVERSVKEHCPWAAAIVKIAADPKLGPILQECEGCYSDEISVKVKHKCYTCEKCGCITFRRSYGMDKLMEETASRIPEMVVASFLAAQKEWLEGLKCAARKVIAGYTMSAATLGFTPLPFQSRLFISPLQLALVVHLANTYGLTLSRKASLHIVMVVGSVALGATAGCFVANLLKTIPGLNVFAMLSDAAISGAATAAIGMLAQELFIKVRGKAIVGEVTQEHLLEVMALEEQRRYFQDYLSRFAAPFQELLTDLNPSRASDLPNALEHAMGSL